MRNVKYGKFADRRMPSTDDWMDTPIGVHNIIRREEQDILRTVGNEYYIQNENTKYNHVVEDPTFMEKALARLKYVFTPKKKKVIGYREDGSVSKKDIKDKSNSDKKSWELSKEEKESILNNQAINKDKASDVKTKKMNDREQEL